MGGAYTICWPVLGSITVARFTRLGVRSRGPWNSESERVAFGGWDASRCRRARSSVDRHAGCRAMIAAAVAALQLRADDALTPECQKWLAYSWAALRVDIAPRIFELSSVVHKPAAVAWPIAPSLGSTTKVATTDHRVQEQVAVAVRYGPLAAWNSHQGADSC